VEEDENPDQFVQ